jgi:hypothetical protein
VDQNAIAALMQQQPMPGAGLGTQPTTPVDSFGQVIPPMSDPTGGMGAERDLVGAPMPPPQFLSTDPNALALVVQEALANQAAQDHALLEAQQRQAALAAQPIIDQMMMSAAGGEAYPMMGATPPPELDPAPAFGEAVGLPPLPSETGF